MGDRMNTAEKLARIGYDVLLDSPTLIYDDEPDSSVDAAESRDMAYVKAKLLHVVRAKTGCDGVNWMLPITWPDRVPGLITWSGQMTLAKSIAKLQDALRVSTSTDLFTLTMPLTGATGIDAIATQNTSDIGFSPNKLSMPVNQRVGLELLAIVGLESVPLVSFGPRDCGFIHDGKAWRFAVEDRDGGYLKRWGNVDEYKTT